MRIKDGFVLRNICGANVVSGEGFDQVNFSKLITLNDTALYLWQSVEGKDFDTETLTSLLLERYDVEEAVAKRDAQNLIDKWVEIGVIA